MKYSTKKVDSLIVQVIARVLCHLFTLTLSRLLILGGFVMTQLLVTQVLDCGARLQRCR